MQTIVFTKMHGAGNDYIYVNTLLYHIADPAAMAVAWSDRHKGIGSDGLVLIGKPSNPAKADFSMRIFNADGSEAMMCGNACRCVGRYLYERGLTKKVIIELETLSGVRTLVLRQDPSTHPVLPKGEGVVSVAVDMSVPVFNNPSQYDSTCGGQLTAGRRKFDGLFVSMGNPHFVVFTDELDTLDVARYGRLLEHNKVFPERCNIEFVQVTDNDRIRVRVWERGSGITMACGTGACAAAVAAATTGRTSHKVEIVMDGGTLHVEWNEHDGHVYLSGPAEFVFDGEIECETPPNLTKGEGL